MTIKSKKIVQMTHNLDKKCILMIFIEFQNFEILCPIFPDFWQKTTTFFRWCGKNFGKKISTENRTSSWKMVPLVHKLVEMYPRVQARNILRFSNFTAAEVCWDDIFWQKMVNFTKKMPSQRTLAAIKLEKRIYPKIPW